MFLPPSTDVYNAASTLQEALGAGATNAQGRKADVRAVFSAILADATKAIDTALRTAATGADLAAFFTASGIVDRQAFVLTSSADTTDVALAGEKGGAVADGDIFVRDGATVLYRGTRAEYVSTVADAVALHAA